MKLLDLCGFLLVTGSFVGMTWLLWVLGSTLWLKIPFTLGIIVVYAVFVITYTEREEVG